MTIYHKMYIHNINNREMSCARFTLVTINTLHTSNIAFFNKKEQKKGEGYSPDKNNHHMHKKIFQNVGDQPQSCYYNCSVLYVRARGISQAEKKPIKVIWACFTVCAFLYFIETCMLVICSPNIRVHHIFLYHVW